MQSNGLTDTHIVTSFPIENSNTSLPTVFNMTDQANLLKSYEKYAKMLVPIIFGCICVIGLFGNLLVIIVILKDKDMRNTTNILVLSLSVADLLFILLCVPTTAISYVLPIWPFGEVACKMITYSQFVSVYASVYTLVIMSLDRYLAVVHAIRSMMYRSERNTWIVIAVIWIVTLCGNTPIIIQWGVYNYEYQGDNRAICIQLSALDDMNAGKIFYGCFLLLGCVIPLGIIMLMYGLMLKRLLYGGVPGGGSQSAESMRAKNRVTRMVIIVVVIFGICWLPTQIILFWQKVSPSEETVNSSLMLVANCIGYINSCVNPILYAFLSGSIRGSIRKTLCCSKRCYRHE